MARAEANKKATLHDIGRSEGNRRLRRRARAVRYYLARYYKRVRRLLWLPLSLAVGLVAGHLAPELFGQWGGVVLMVIGALWLVLAAIWGLAVVIAKLHNRFGPVR